MKVFIVFGARPEAIEMAPVVQALKVTMEADTRVCVTAQHRAMLDQVLSLFQISPDYDLNLITSGQTLSEISSRILVGVTGVLEQWTTDLILVHGDATTTAMTSMACFYQRIPVGYVEAGLRTGNMWSPWPEEFNHRLAGLVTRLHFAPTEQVRTNLLAEKIPADWIEVTGNTVVSALLQVSDCIDHDLQAQFQQKLNFLDDRKRILFVTGHRRENFGGGMQSIRRGLLALSKCDDLEIVYPVHRNPNVSGPVEERLAGQPGIHLLAPQDYLSFAYLMKRCSVLLTDRGGIQEEAPALDKPVLVMQDATERPEAVAAGTVRLVDTDAANIEREVATLLDDWQTYLLISISMNPYGDGTAAQQICSSVERYLASA